MRSLHLRALLCAAALLSASCGDGPTGPRETPYEELPAVALGGSVSATLTAGDSTDYALVQPAQSFRLVLQARSGSAADSIMAEILDETGQAVSRVASTGSDAGARPRTGTWVVPRAGRLRIRVRGRGADDAGAYTLALGVQDAGPEWVPSLIPINQVVQGEQIEGDGDVDEFRIPGRAGAEWIVFAMAGPEWSPLRVELVDSATGRGLAAFAIANPATLIEGHSSGRVVLPATGTYLLRVTPVFPWSPQYTGEYSVKVYPVNRAPESAPAALQPGDVVDEPLGEVGDVDEFTFTAAAGQQINLLLQLREGMSYGLDVRLLRADSQVASLDASSPHGSIDDYGTGRMTLEGGQYTVRAHGPVTGPPGRATGSYRLELYPVDRAPENGARVALDAPPAQGVIDRPSDIDEYAFQGTAGQNVVIHLDVPAPLSTQRALFAELVSPSGVTLSEAEQYWSEPLYSMPYGKRVQLGATGTYRLRVSGGPDYSFVRGAYTIEAYTINPGPEHVPAAVALGQTVTGERIDRPGDLDLFTFTGQAGSQGILFAAAPVATGISGSVRGAGDAATWMRIYPAGTKLDSVSTGRFDMTDRAYEIAFSGYQPGAYSFRLATVNRPPEGRPAAYTLGDTVRSELLYPSGDIDEYTFELAAPARLGVYWRTHGTLPDDAVTGRLIDVVTGAVRWHSWSSARSVDLPAGRYRFEVMNPNYDAPLRIGHYPRLSYAFALRP